MALDAALAESVRAGGAPFLRFYQWNPGTLSLGRFQNPDSGLSPASREVPRVRRPTGGGGIWHGDELTYSLGCLQSDIGITGVKASFELLCGFLLDTWRSLGWDARFAKDAPEGGTEWGAFTPACFAGREEYDILVQGKKLGGNAQQRDRLSIFQHGSLPRVLDRARLEALFLPGFRPDPLQTTDLASCGWTSGPGELIPLLSDRFAARVGASLRTGAPSAAETDRAAVLERERYADADWTETGGGSLRPS